jgi:hypothetical protein
MEELTTGQRATLARVLDEIVPPSPDMPGAGELGLAAVVERFLQRTPGAVAALAESLDAVAAQGFATVAAQNPGFVPGLLFPTYTSYYQDPRVYAALGLEPRPPHPQGHALEPGDFSGLEAVRRRGKIYREC